MQVEKKRLRQLVIVVVLALSLLTSVFLIRTTLSTYRLYKDALGIRDIIKSDITIETILALDEPLHAVSRHFDAFYRQVYDVSRIGGLLSWVPQIGGTLKQAPELLDLASEALDTGIEVYDLLTPVLRDADSDADMVLLVPEIAAILSDHQVPLLVRIDGIASRLDNLQIESLHPQLAEPLSSVDTLLPLIQAGLRLSDHIPQILGFGDEPEDQRVYLILALNEDELRPGGGFISSVGEFVIQNADVVSVDFSDSYHVDDFRNPYPFAPEPLQVLMGLQLWVFRDSNWSPNFPTSIAQGLQVYYPKDRDRPDFYGAFTIDQYSVQALVAAFGQIKIQNHDEPITADTVIDYMRTAYEPDDGEITNAWWKTRKNFIVDLSNVMMRKLMNGNVNWVVLGETLVRLMDEHHLQVCFFDEDINQVLADKGWDGQVETPAGDHVLIAEANLGYNKSSTLIQRDFTYTIDLTGAQPKAKLQARYKHTSERDIACVPEGWYSATYEEMMNKCSWVYLQVYVPQDAALVAYSTHAIPAEQVITGKPWSGEPIVRSTTEVSGTTAFEQAFVLPTKSQTEVVFEYTLPSTVIDTAGSQYRYRLNVQQQAGLSEIPFTLILRLPENAVLLNDTSLYESHGPGQWEFVTVLKRDIEIDVNYIIQQDDQE